MKRPKATHLEEPKLMIPNDGKFHEGLLESCKKMVRKLWRCVCKILLRVMLILKVHDRYEHREVRPAQGKVKDVKFRA